MQSDYAEIELYAGYKWLEFKLVISFTFVSVKRVTLLNMCFWLNILYSNAIRIVWVLAINSIKAKQSVQHTAYYSTNIAFVSIEHIKCTYRIIISHIAYQIRLVILVA